MDEDHEAANSIKELSPTMPREAPEEEKEKVHDPDALIEQIRRQQLAFEESQRLSKKERGKNSTAEQEDEIGREMLKVFTKMSADVTKSKPKKSSRFSGIFSLFSSSKKKKKDDEEEEKESTRDSMYNKNNGNLVDLIRLENYIQIIERGKGKNANTAKLKTEAYYCTGQLVEEGSAKNFTRVKGTLTVSENLIYFEPTAHLAEGGLEHDQFRMILDLLGMEPSHFQACIDYLDIESVQKIRGFNTSGEEYVSDPKLKRAYLYDYYV